MIPAQTPLGIDDDIGTLRQSLSKIVLPAEKNQLERLIGLLESDLLSITEFTREIMQAPVVALQICRAAGESARSRDIDILTLEQACGLLGTQRLALVLKSIPTIEQDELPLAYRQLLSISEHAQMQAHGLFAHRMARLWHEMSLACLLFLAPCWAMIYTRPDMFEQWDARHLFPDAFRSKADAVFLDSSDVLALAQQIAEDWWLPPWILQGYRSLGTSRKTIVKALHIARDTDHPHEQQLKLDADKQLYRWLTQPANSLLMTNGIALASHHDWEARHTRRWQQLIALYLGAALPAVQRDTHENAVASAHRQSSKAGLWHPAEALLWPRATRCNTRASHATPPNDSSTRGQRADPAAWRRHCADLLNRPSRFATLADLMSTALNAIIEGLGVSECWIALYNGRQQQLVISVSAGYSGDDRPTGTALGPCRGNAWGDWLASSTRHDMDRQAQTRLASLLPAPLKTISSDRSYHLLPLMLNGALLGLVYTSNGPDQPLLDDKRAAALIKTVDCLLRALEAFKTRA
ncbi:hypothetical protein KEM63_03855 [Halopseudomonas nanhaiensis]|uniref:hypothetical protein n=1 Tax=Halopseudomonas nanhaiensis TaxID=2830842 RepID=UPI001CBB0E4E|nr:hypothetical protein [Halopseudomonas nanhaiensis]UAW99120.1 hypothetical protein KEM63_03855 [Halopseudomonas nanhaiensis]